jgi:hypothetical protein
MSLKVKNEIEQESEYRSQESVGNRSSFFIRKFRLTKPFKNCQGGAFREILNLMKTELVSKKHSAFLRGASFWLLAPVS